MARHSGKPVYLNNDPRLLGAGDFCVCRSARLFTILIVEADEVVFSGADDEQAQQNALSAELSNNFANHY